MYARLAGDNPAREKMTLSEMTVQYAREHLDEVVDRAGDSDEHVIIRSGSRAAVVISLEDYQEYRRLKYAAEEVHAAEAEEVHEVRELPPEVMARIEESRLHPERLQDRPSRASRV